ncbi:L-rhamnose mutarotase [Paracoccus marcusii]|uniref:L-rhamnose mutarotase n=1 Tax=Paracoccus marcusii TaxID=59779 RepID=UPI0032675DF8
MENPAQFWVEINNRGTDFAADDSAIGADPVTRDWWALCGPMQRPLDTRSAGEWWAGLTEVFHSD